MLGRVVAVAVVQAALSLAAPGAVAQSQETARGRVLYEMRCGLCHDRSVHQRNPRAARSFAEIRSFVVRWDRELGAVWRDEEIDAVSRYLNDRYYHYPCPPGVCKSERAQPPRAPGPGAFAQR